MRRRSSGIASAPLGPSSNLSTLRRHRRCCKRSALLGGDVVDPCQGGDHSTLLHCGDICAPSWPLDLQELTHKIFRGTIFMQAQLVDLYRAGIRSATDMMK